MPRPPFSNSAWSCASCRTSTTPVRRAGKSLCNACGLRRQKIARTIATKPRPGRPRKRTSTSFSRADAQGQRRRPRPPPIAVPAPSFAEIVEAMSPGAPTFPQPPCAVLSPTDVRVAAEGPHFHPVSPDEMCAGAASPMSPCGAPEALVAAQTRPAFSAGEDEGRGPIAGAVRENLDALTALLCGGATEGRWCGEGWEAEGQVALST